MHHFKILFFIALAVTLIGLCKLFEASFYVFSVLCILLAIVFPFIFEVLERKSVDVWYYPLGVVGVVLMVQSQQHEIAILQSMYLTESKQEHLDMILLDQERVNRLLNEDDFRTLERYLKTSLEQSYEIVKSHYQYCILDTKSNIDYCDKYENELGMLQKLISADSIQEGIQKFNFVENGSKLRGVINISTPKGKFQDDIYIKSSDVLGLFSETHQAASKKAIEKVLEESVNYWEDIVSFSKNRTTEAQQIAPASTPKLLAYLIWPYVLCIALCLKIARYKIFTREISD